MDLSGCFMGMPSGWFRPKAEITLNFAAWFDSGLPTDAAFIST